MHPPPPPHFTNHHPYTHVWPCWLRCSRPRIQVNQQLRRQQHNQVVGMQMQMMQQVMAQQRATAQVSMAAFAGKATPPLPPPSSPPFTLLPPSLLQLPPPSPQPTRASSLPSPPLLSAGHNGGPTSTKWNNAKRSTGLCYTFRVYFFLGVDCPHDPTNN